MNIFSTVVKFIRAAVSKSYFNKDGKTPVATVDIADGMGVNGFIKDNAIVILPYGLISKIPAGTSVCLTDTTGGATPYVLGVVQSLPLDSPLSENDGDVALASLNFAIKLSSTSVQYFNLKNPNYIATAVSGEWMKKILSDIIADSNGVDATTIRGYINTVILPALNSLIPAPLPPLASSVKLSNDLLAIQSDNILVNNSGTIPPVQDEGIDE